MSASLVRRWRLLRRTKGSSSYVCECVWLCMFVREEEMMSVVTLTSVAVAVDIGHILNLFKKGHHRRIRN